MQAADGAVDGAQQGLEAMLASLPSQLVEATSGVIDREMLPVVAVSVLLPLALFGWLLFTDLLKGLLDLVTGKKPDFEVQPIPFTEEADAAMAQQSAAGEDALARELSAWPAILGIKRSLEALAPEEQRRLKLETGTNFPPRTPTTKPFAIDREGYTFFQGPSPRTAVQEGMPSFFSAENFQNLEVPPVLLVLGGVGGLAFLVVAATLVIS